MSINDWLAIGTRVAIPKPLLFLHIPKTAGTSFLLMLQNTFGDRRVRRIRKVDENIKETIAQIVKCELDDVSCLTGHLPLHLFNGFPDTFRLFTVLRDPISRVLSLYRFLKTCDPAEWKRLELPQDFTLDDFLSSAHPELYGQVNNGMVRMLCGDPRWEDFEVAQFWDTTGWVEPLKRAITNLKQIDFGLTEKMAFTLELARTRWSVPYELPQYRENTTERETITERVDDIHRIIAMNTFDVALYRWAAEEFRKQTRALPNTPENQFWNPRTVFFPTMGREACVADIPGRCGFHEFESIAVAWLQADQVANIHFVGDSSLVRLRMLLLCVIKDYPTDDIIVSVNGQPVKTIFRFVEERWGWLETELFNTNKGVNRMMIQAPMFLSASDLDPLTADRRRLGIGLANVEFQT